MAVEAINKVHETITETEKDSSAQISASAETDLAANSAKRDREVGDESKKNRVVKKQRLEGFEVIEVVDGENDSVLEAPLGVAPVKVGPVSVGPRSFETSVDMFHYFHKLLHGWCPNLNINKYEHMMLLDLLQKGHLEPEKNIGNGIHAFQVRFHPKFKSRCFFLVRNDESVVDFSFRKCVDHILPLPETMQIKSDVNKALGGRYGGGRGGGGGRGAGCGVGESGAAGGGGGGRGGGLGGGDGRVGGRGRGRGRGRGGGSGRGASHDRGGRGGKPRY